MTSPEKNIDTCQTKRNNEKSSTEYETISSTALEAPFIKKFPSLSGEEERSYENDYCRAKAYLMRQCTETGDSLWDHLNDVLKRILTEQPRNIGDTFEEFSFRVREARFRDKTDHLRDLYVPPEDYSLSQKLIVLLQPTDETLKIQGKPEEEEEEEQRIKPDFMELLYFFEQAGVGLPRPEMFCLALHIKKLVSSLPIEKYRFWGKILGLKKNYYIVETELNEDEIARRNAEREEKNQKMNEEDMEKEAAEREELKQKREQEMELAKQREIDFAEERSRVKHEEMLREARAQGLKEMPEPIELHPWPPIPPLPLPPASKTGSKRVCPSEPTGVGVNKKTYFLCSSPGDEWIELPDVTPEQIVTARKIKRSFTGDLDSQVNTYPTFPGTEKNYLRAQIARISSGTHISPLGYYTFNEEEEPEGEEEGASRTNYVENPDYEPVSIKDLTDPSMAFWVHHSSYILKQGRTTWWNPFEEDEEGEEEEEDGVEEGAEVGRETEEREIGPELLTPLSEDAALDSITPWSARSTSNLFPEFAIAIVRSNLWPGAYAFATARKFENVYIGYGHKFSATNHSPEPTGEIQYEYPTGPEVMEILDPTPEEEEAWRIAHEVKSEEEEEEEEEEELMEDEEPEVDD